MAYTPNYTTDDLELITGDVIGGTGAGLAPMMTIAGVFLGIGLVVAVGAFVVKKYR
jgi:hypothetical protein